MIYDFKMGKKILSLLLALSAQYAFAQCTNVPVKEAVRNGDFEAGYLSGAGTKHTATAGSDFDFYSDMDFKGQKISSAANGCHYGIGDGYAVARAENFTCASSNWTNNTYWGMSYGGDANFKDHTPGKAGKGYALLVDLNNRQTSPKRAENLSPGNKRLIFILVRIIGFQPTLQISLLVQHLKCRLLLSLNWAGCKI